MKIPYERIVQWAAGPIAIVAGAVAVWLDNHFGLLGKAGLGQDETAKAIFDSLTFAVGAAVTYLSHSKWMTNLAAWWQKAQSLPNDYPQPPLPPIQGGAMTTEDDTPDNDEQEETDGQFEDEPGYDDPGPGVEPDQDLDNGESE